MKRFSPLPFLLVCCLLFPNFSRAQQKPEDAVTELLTAKDEATVLAHLPKVAVSELDRISHEQREEFLGLFMVGKSLAAEGIELSRSSENPLEFQFLRKDGERGTLTHTGTELQGDNAAVHFLVVTPEARTPVIVHMRREDGSWRLINVEAEGKHIIPDLDNPEQGPKEMIANKLAAYQSSAVGALRTINTGAITYNAYYPEVGFPPDLKSLGPAPDGTNSYTQQHAGMLDSGLACADPICIKSGYKIYYQRVDKNHYRVSAMPVTYGVTGAQSYFTNETGIIRVTSEDREAHESDEPLQ